MPFLKTNNLQIQGTVAPLPCSVLVVDDDTNMLDILVRSLRKHGCECEGVNSAMLALEKLKSTSYDVLVTDLKMPQLNGLDLLAAVSEANFDLVPIVVTGNSTISEAVEAVKLGAFDIIEKPGGLPLLGMTVDRAYQHKQLHQYATIMAESVLQWELTFDAVHDLISIVDSHGHFVRVNKAMATHIGSDATGRSFREIMGVQEGHECPDNVLDALYGRAFGGFYHVTVSPLISAQGETIGSLHVARDITEAYEAEMQLREAHEETERLLAAMSYFLIGLDANCRVRRWNAAAAETFGTSAASVVGRDFRETGILWNWDAIQEAMPRCGNTDETIRLSDVRYTTPTGTEGILEVTLSPVHNEAGDSVGMCLIGNDVTIQKNLESQLARAQKLESIGQLASGIAHEINTPIQYIGDNVRFLKDSHSDLQRLHEISSDLLNTAEAKGFEPDKVAAIREVIEDIDAEYLFDQMPKAISDSLEGIERVATIVLAMKEFSHPGSAEKSPVDLNRAIESTITVARNEWKYVADVVTDLDSEAPLVCCLPGEFNQVILNIIINAAHAIKDAQEVASAEKGVIKISTRAEANWFEICITDSGTGIPEHVRSRIFDPFFTTKEVGRGTGQGLAIAHNVIVEKHNGQLTFDTALGKGTTFVIRLPIEG